MIPVLQLDPMSLAIWLRNDVFGGKRGHARFSAMLSAWHGVGLTETVKANAESLDETHDLAWFGSCMWHEKRHFFDLILSSYGAWRIRHMFVIAGSSLVLGKELTDCGQPLYFPHTVYHDRVRRGGLGIGTISQKAEAIAEDLFRRKRSLADESAPLEEDGLKIKLGGDAQMEALALISQLHTLAGEFGGGTAIKIYETYVRKMDRGGLYRWIELLSQALGCARETPDGTLQFDHELATALMVGGLCGRWLGDRSDPSVTLPSERLGRLMKELGPTPGRIGMATDECAELVDCAARRIWGRGLWDELDADLGHMTDIAEQMRREYGSDSGLYLAFDNLLTVRAAMLDIVVNEGPAAMSPRAFGATWAKVLRPMLLYTAPSGTTWTPNDDPRTVEFGGGVRFDGGDTMAWAWTWRDEEEKARSGGISLNDDRWAFIVKTAAPLTKLALAGRSHDLMLEPELQSILDDLARDGFDVRFDQRFAYPPMESHNSRKTSLKSYAELVGKSEFVCDITGDLIRVDNGIMIRPWDFRRSPLRDRFLEECVEGPTMGEVRLRQDWTYWIVREDLLP